ncbi:hypothetical protein BD413DRAFT_610392 [Trametes elegans]|nr:hypothetical protein BD413DRAFT_610392 [Trametes elegans]
MPPRPEPLQDGVPSPAKKRRLMQTPDGFETSRRASGSKTAARKFASAFDKPKPSTKGSVAQNTRPLTPPVAGPSKQSAASPPAQAPGMRPWVMPEFEQTSKAPARQQQNKEARLRRLSETPVLQPPPVAGPSSKPIQNRKVSILSAHRIPSPASPKTPVKPVSKAGISRFQPVLPAPALSKNPPKELRALQPPPPPPLLPRKGAPVLDPSKLKTILTTRVAVAMDPRTESGTNELLGIYLEQNAANHVPPAERELQRGLKQSPEKASKSKSAKFVRGGLAERAQRLIAKHNTTLTLWHKDMELQAQRPHAHARVAPDLAVRVVEVLHLSSVASLQRSQSVPRLCVARCARVSPGGKEGRGGGEGDTGTVAVVLDFGSPGSAAARAHMLDEVREGMEVHIWRPWNTIEGFGDPGSKSVDSLTPFRLPIDWLQLDWGTIVPF